MKPQDTKAESITFGVELETTIPALSGVTIGGYHNGSTVTVGAANGTTQHLTAPPSMAPIGRPNVTVPSAPTRAAWPVNSSHLFSKAARA